MWLQITPYEATKRWHPKLSSDEGLYRTSPYEFAETSDSSLQLISVEATAQLGNTIIFKSPLSEIQSSSSVIGNENT
jgi:hypothetical protein